MVKATFTLDEVTVARLRRTADRLGRPQSQIVRDAIRDYADHVGRLGDEERARLLDAFDRLVPRIPSKTAAAVDAELRVIRAARRKGGRRRPA